MRYQIILFLITVSISCLSAGEESASEGKGGPSITDEKPGAAKEGAPKSEMSTEKGGSEKPGVSKGGEGNTSIGKGSKSAEVKGEAKDLGKPEGVVGEAKGIGDKDKENLGVGKSLSSLEEAKDSEEKEVANEDDSKIPSPFSPEGEDSDRGFFPRPPSGDNAGPGEGPGNAPIDINNLKVPTKDNPTFQFATLGKNSAGVCQMNLIDTEKDKDIAWMESTPLENASRYACYAPIKRNNLEPELKIFFTVEDIFINFKDIADTSAKIAEKEKDVEAAAEGESCYGLTASHCVQGYVEKTAGGEERMYEANIKAQVFGNEKVRVKILTTKEYDPHIENKGGGAQYAPNDRVLMVLPAKTCATAAKNNVPKIKLCSSRVNENNHAMYAPSHRQNRTVPVYSIRDGIQPPGILKTIMARDGGEVVRQGDSGGTLLVENPLDDRKEGRWRCGMGPVSTANIPRGTEAHYVAGPKARQNTIDDLERLMKRENAARSSSKQFAQQPPSQKTKTNNFKPATIHVLPLSNSNRF